MSSRAKRGILLTRASGQPLRRSLASLGMTRVGVGPPYLTSSPAPAAPAPRAERRIFGIHAATIGSITPPAPTAFMIWVRSRNSTVVPRLIAMPDRRTGARGLVIASGAPNRAMMKQVAGIASLSARSTISLLASLPEPLQGLDVAAQLRVAHLVRRLRLGQQVGRRLGQRPEPHGAEAERRLLARARR